MLRNKSTFSILAVLVMLSMLLAACGGAPAATDEPAEPAAPAAPAATDEPAAPAATDEPMEEVVLVIGTTDSWSSFESGWVYSFHDWELFHQCADGLLNSVPGSAGEVEPALAESYDISDDGTEFTFHLRSGVVFPDGTPFNADAVVFSFERIAAIDNDENAGFLYTAYASGVEKIDDMTVKVTFSAPYAFAAQLVATNPWKILNPNAWSATERGTENTACGIGPYVIESFAEGEEAVFVANESYYGAAPKVSKVVVRYFADSSTMALALQSGEVDVAWKSLSPADFDAMQGAAGVTTEVSGGTEIRYIVWNVRTAPYDNADVRLGLSMLLNREELTDLGWQGTKVPLFSMVPPGFLGEKPTFAGTEDVEAGKALLATAGYNESNPLVLDLWYSPTHYGDTEPDVAAIIKQQWEASGVVTVNLQFLEWAAYRDAGRANELPVSLLGWYPDYLDSDNYLNPFAHSPASWSGSGYNNPDMDALLDAQAGELDEAARVALLGDVQDLWATEVPFTPLGQGALYVAYNDNVSNFILDPLSLAHYFLVEKK